jgi:hypothetical protein
MRRHRINVCSRAPWWFYSPGRNTVIIQSYQYCKVMSKDVKDSFMRSTYNSLTLLAADSAVSRLEWVGSTLSTCFLLAAESLLPFWGSRPGWAWLGLLPTCPFSRASFLYSWIPGNLPILCREQVDWPSCHSLRQLNSGTFFNLSAQLLWHIPVQFLCLRKFPVN